MTVRNIEKLRDILFDQLESLADPKKEVDLDRSKLINETAQLIVNTAKVEVEHAKVLKGALTLPFIEGQDSVQERPYQSIPGKSPSQPTKEEPVAGQKQSTMEKVLHGNAGHPWRGMGNWKAGRA